MSTGYGISWAAAMIVSVTRSRETRALFRGRAYMPGSSTRAGGAGPRPPGPLAQQVLAGVADDDRLAAVGALEDDAVDELAEVVGGEALQPDGGRGLAEAGAALEADGGDGAGG